MPAHNRRSSDAHLDLAHELADTAGRETLRYFRKTFAVENKGGAGAFDPVTAADRAAERAIRRHLAKAQPEHGIVGEEYARREGAGRFNWVIDPIDGTKAFVMGSPMWGTLIGLMDGRAPVLGLMDQPFTRERVWSGTRGTQWRLPDGKVKKVSTRACARLADAILTTTSPDLLGGEDELGAFLLLKAQVRMTRYGGDCYGYCLLAAGHVDLVVETGLKPHDVIALIPIIEGAGGVITTWEGEPAAGGGRIVAAGDARLHAAALRLLNG